MTLPKPLGSNAIVEVHVQMCNNYYGVVYLLDLMWCVSF